MQSVSSTPNNSRFIDSYHQNSTRAKFLLSNWRINTSIEVKVNSSFPTIWAAMCNVAIKHRNSRAWKRRIRPERRASMFNSIRIEFSWEYFVFYVFHISVTLKQPHGKKKTPRGEALKMQSRAVVEQTWATIFSWTRDLVADRPTMTVVVVVI